jgi:hypothetical protein
LTTPFYADFVPLFSHLLSHGRLAEDVRAGALTFLAELFFSTQDPLVLVLGASVGRSIPIDEETALNFIELAFNFLDTHLELCLKAISAVLPLVNAEHYLAILERIGILREAVLASPTFSELMCTLQEHFMPFVAPVVSIILELVLPPLGFARVEADEVDLRDPMYLARKCGNGYIICSAQSQMALHNLLYVPIDLLDHLWEFCHEAVAPVVEGIIEIAARALPNRYNPEIIGDAYDILSSVACHFGPLPQLMSVLADELPRMSLYLPSSLLTGAVVYALDSDEAAESDFENTFRGLAQAIVSLHEHIAAFRETDSYLCGWDEYNHEATVVNIGEVFRLGARRVPGLTVQVFTELQNAIPYFAALSEYPLIQAMSMRIWSELACGIAGFTVPATFLGDLRALLDSHDPIVQLQSLRAISQLICHHNLVNELDIMAVLTDLVQVAPPETAMHALTASVRLIEHFFDQLRNTEYIPVLLKLFPVTLERLARQNLIPLLSAALDLGRRLAANQFPGCKDFLDVVHLYMHPAPLEIAGPPRWLSRYE